MTPIEDQWDRVLILEDYVDFGEMDDRDVLIASVDPPLLGGRAPHFGFFLRLHSWDVRDGHPECHADARQLHKRRVRVTLEILRDEP